MSEDLRGRFKHKPEKKEPDSVRSSSDKGIFGIWEDQRRMQLEEDRIAKELAETKRKAKELSRTLRNHRYGEIREESLNKINQYRDKTISQIRKMKEIVKGFASSKKYLSIGAAVFVLLIGASIAIGTRKSDTQSTLGDSTENSSTAADLPEESPSFSILTPAGKSEEQLSIRRTNPSNSASSYTFIDNLQGSDVPFQVTQQEIPANFNLEKTATDFQATSIIQIDDNRVYHGLSDKTKVQSLIFIKEGKLVLISSPQKFSDEQWAGYISGLN